jgi:hypothetical protein
VGIVSYESRRGKAGQEVVKKFTMLPLACKFTRAPYVLAENMWVATAVTDVNYTGSVTSATVDSSYVTLWGGNTQLYVRVPLGDGEIIKITITTAGSFNVVERRCFGTPAGIIPVATLKISHLGEIDGSCYGYAQTCNSAGNYITNSDFYRKPLVFATAPLPAGSIYMGGLDFKALTYSSAEIKAGESMGSRSMVSGSIADQQDNDNYMAYYPSQRTSYGTLFGKLLARNPFFSGVPCIYSVGLRDAGTLQEPEWEHRRLVIDKVNLSDDRFTFSALDPLILTEGKKAKMPITSPAQLTAAITTASTSLTFGNAPAGYFGTSGNIIVRIESELIEVTANGTATMPIVQRGFGRTTKNDHAINSTVQNCLRFVDEHVIDCITYAISTWTDAGQFLDDYSATKALMPTYIISDYVLSSPTDVAEFINKLIFVGNLIFYFDDVTQKIVIKYIREESLEPIFIDEQNHIKKGSVKRDLNHKDFYTRFGMSWAPFDLTKETDEKNQQISLMVANLELESPAQMGEINERKSVIMPLLTNSTDDYLLGASTVTRLASSEQAPEIFECELDAETIGSTQGGTLELGSIVNISSSENQSKTGQAEARLYQLVKFYGDPFGSYKAKFKRYQRLEPTEFDFVIEAGTYINYVLSDHYAPTVAGIYTVYIKAGAEFGSQDTSLFAFDTGTQAAGVTIKLLIRGSILGMGGAGGNRGFFVEPSGTSATNGENGGGAIIARCPLIIDCGSGLIWAGGGGGGGDTVVDIISAYIVRGGGGGQGYGISLGGTARKVFVDTQAANGSRESAGISDISVSGGEWGESGGNGTSFGGVFAAGGLAGESIRSNGHTITIIAGDNPLSIRGRRT